MKSEIVSVLAINGYSTVSGYKTKPVGFGFIVNAIEEVLIIRMFAFPSESTLAPMFPTSCFLETPLKSP